MIKNLTNGTVISMNEKKANNFTVKTLGMILNKNSAGLVFKTRFGIHTFFMKKEIDVIVLDNDNTVVKIRRNLKPNSIFLWNPKFDILIELPKESISNSKTKVGDTLKLA